MMRRSASIGAAIVICIPFLDAQIAGERVRTFQTSNGAGIREERGRVTLSADGVESEKRYVLRTPTSADGWNGTLLIAAHGGSGGIEHQADGTVSGTADTALDDVLGLHASEQGYAYASVDRDGVGGTREGLALTLAFTRVAGERAGALLGRPPARVYLAGLSMGGGIARYAAEDPLRPYDGILIIAGAQGDIPARLDRQAEMAALWSAVDPRTHPDVRENDPKVLAYARAVATPVGARAFWPFVGASATPEGLRRMLERFGLTGLSDGQLASFRAADFAATQPFATSVARANTTGRVFVPTIEVAGTFDDLVIREILAYADKVARVDGSPSPASLHRLYLVDGVWHISGDDDAVGSFLYEMKRGGVAGSVQQALREGPSYIPTVRESLERLDRWIREKVPPPPNQTVRPGEPLRIGAGRTTERAKGGSAAGAHRLRWAA